MNNTTNNRIIVRRSISALRLVSLSLGLFLIAAVPMTANAQKETTPIKPIEQPGRLVQKPVTIPERPLEKKTADEKPVEEKPVEVSPVTVTVLVTLPKAPAAINAMTAGEIVTYKLDLIAADIQHLKDRIKDRQQRENDITSGKVAGANPQQVQSMKDDDKSDQNQINNLDAEAKAIPKMTPKGQLQIARANFNSHLSSLKTNKAFEEGQIKEIKQRPASRLSIAALNEAQNQVAQDDKDIDTLTQMVNNATAQINAIK